MSVYVGKGENKGMTFFNDGEALFYAFNQCGIYHYETYEKATAEFKQMFLDWFYSGEWCTYTDDEYYLLEERIHQPTEDELRDIYEDRQKERVCWDNAQQRNESRM